MKGKTVTILGVFGNDQVGIIADISGLLFKLGCNLEDMSMTRLDELFAMMVVFKKPKKWDEKRWRMQITAFERKRSLACFWHDYKVAPRKLPQVKDMGAEYLIRAIGPDRTGIVASLSGLMAKHKLNITDLNSKKINSSKTPLYALMLETKVRPSGLSALEKELQSLGRKLHIDIKISPVMSLEM